ncbi:MAG: hypothetical protein ACE3JP_14670 [Ectobacillus sp.]
MQKHEFTFLLRLLIGFIIERPVLVNNINGSSNNIKIGNRAYGNGNATKNSKGE